MVPGSRPDRVRARSALYLQTTHALPANPPPRVLSTELRACACAGANQMSPDPGPRVRATRWAAPIHGRDHDNDAVYHRHLGGALLQFVNLETTCGTGDMRRHPL